MPPETAPSSHRLVFLKLGGSLITDKTSAYSARDETIARLAREVRQALLQQPQLRLVLAHGSGSFGHWEAAQYGTRQGVSTQSQWYGFAAVAAAAARLNRIVADAFLREGVPVLSIAPSSTARCRGHVLEYLDVGPIRVALAHGLVPLVYGDVAFDDVCGGTIVSTEDIFAYLAQRLAPDYVLLAGEVEGVLDRSGQVVRCISPATLPALDGQLTGSRGVDVTGGMADKVAQMVGLVGRQPSVCARVFSGAVPGTVEHLLVDPAADIGTRIAAA